MKIFFIIFYNLVYVIFFFRQGLASGQPPGEPGGVSTSSVSGQGGGNIVSNSMMAQQPNRGLRDPLIGGLQANPPSYTHYPQQRDVCKMNTIVRIVVFSSSYCLIYYSCIKYCSLLLLNVYFYYFAN